MKNILKTLIFISLFLNFLNANDLDLDLDKALKQAQKENKTFMIFFHMPNCRYCEIMLEKNFQDKKTLDEIKKHFILFDISIAEKGTVKFKNFKGNKKDFAKFMQAITYPTTVFTNKEGNIVDVARGYRNIDEYLVQIKYIATKSYDDMELEEFADKLEMSDEDDK